MMKRNILAVIVPALLVAGTANAAEIYNKDGNKVDLYGKAVGLHYFSKGNGENSYGGNGDMTYARLGFKGETQINSDLTGYGQWEYDSRVTTLKALTLKLVTKRVWHSRVLNTLTLVLSITAVTTVWFMMHWVTPICCQNLVVILHTAMISSLVVLAALLPIVTPTSLVWLMA